MKNKIRSIDALRALACIVVFLYHSGIKISAPAAVCVFFMLSGFTMTFRELQRGNSSSLSVADCAVSAVKRVAKLYPLHIICLLLVLPLNLLELSRAYSTEALWFFVKKLVLNLLLLQSWVPNADIAVAFNGVAWFLSTIMFLYFCFPFIFTLVKRLSSLRRAFVTMVLLAAVQLVLGFSAAPLEGFLLSKALIPADGKFAYWFSYIFPVFRVFDFSIGCILAWIYVKSPQDMGRRFHIILECVTVFLLLASHLVYRHTEALPQWEAFKYTQIYLPVSAITIYTFAVDKSHIVRLLTNRFTLFISRISSDFFLLHQNIIRFSIMFLSMLAIPFEALKLIIPILCFALTVAACLIWSRIEAAVKSRAKGK